MSSITIPTVPTTVPSSMSLPQAAASPSPPGPGPSAGLPSPPASWRRTSCGPRLPPTTPRRPRSSATTATTDRWRSPSRCSSRSGPPASRHSSPPSSRGRKERLARQPCWGGLGAAAVIAMFAIVSATELALSTYVHRGAPDPSVVSGLWLTHMSVFGVNLMFIAIALAGLTAACVRMGLLSSAWKTVGLVGAGALGVGAMCTPAILNASPVFALAVGGFLVWGAFVVVTSISLLRHSATD